MSEQPVHNAEVDKQAIRLHDASMQADAALQIAERDHQKHQEGNATREKINHRLGEIAAMGSLRRFIHRSEDKQLRTKSFDTIREDPSFKVLQDDKEGFSYGQVRQTAHEVGNAQRVRDQSVENARKFSQVYNSALYDNAVIGANNDFMQRRNEDGSRSETQIVTPDVLLQQLTDHMEGQIDYQPVPGGQVPVQPGPVLKQ